jgi:hypothetical protein
MISHAIVQMLILSYVCLPKQDFEIDAHGAAPTVLPSRLSCEPEWAIGSRCGPNSLYILLTLHGISSELNRVTDECQIDSEKGCSLLDLCNSAEIFGLQCEARIVPPDSLRDLHFPVIAHIGPVDDDGNPGHFLVVFQYRKEDNAFGVIDGTSGVVSYGPRRYCAAMFPDTSWSVAPH